MEYGDYVIKYDFKAKDSSGKTRAGTMEAENLNDFYQKLRDQNLFCVSVQESANQGSGDSLMSKEIKFGSSEKLKLKDITVFCRQFATMMNAGLTVVKCVDILYRQAEKKQIKQVMLQLYESIKKGNALSISMREMGKTFPNLLISMIESGEAAGTLDDVMLSMAAHYEKERALKNKITSAMIYPIVLLVLSVAVVVVLLTFVMPVFFEMFGDNPLPAPTRALLALSNAMIDYWYIFVIGLVVLVVGGWVALKLSVVRYAFDKLKLKIPVAGKLVMTIYTARFSSTVSSLYSGGVPIIEAIKIASNVLGNMYVSEKLDHVVEDIKQGVPFSRAIMNVDVFPPLFSSMVFIGEESGSLDDILLKTSEYYDEESSNAISKLVALMEPIMIIALAGIVAFIVISIAMPMFQSYQYVTQ